jgi:ornithine cyclodeaminase
MLSNNILLLGGDEIIDLLDGREQEMVEVVKRAYIAHSNGQSSLPQSSFLHFTNDDRNRIIALPAYLQDGQSTAGIKWISSFPSNTKKGLERASAVIVLNSVETGRAMAIMEGAEISALRTAASAALAAKTLHTNRPLSSLSLVGCGRINWEVARFVQIEFPEIKQITVFDLDTVRARSFKQALQAQVPGKKIDVAVNLEDAIAASPLISFATTASAPYCESFELLATKTILHLSLRDLSSSVIRRSDNVVDDVDHVCRARTSVHLAEEVTGNRYFIRTTLADILREQSAPRAGDKQPLIFSPFGLGILDIALAQMVLNLALTSGTGTYFPFFPTSRGCRHEHAPRRPIQLSRA